MRGFRYVVRGLRDTLDHLLPFTLYSLLWWVSVIPIVLGLAIGLWAALLGLVVLIVPMAGATVALFAMADPRRTEGVPEVREALAVARQGFRRGWVLALVSLLALLILINNVVYWGSHASFFVVLVPLWLLLLMLAVAIGMSAFAIVALTDSSALHALKLGGLLVGARLGRAIVVVAVLGLLTLISTALVVPLIMFVPAALAAVVDRFVLDGLGLPIPDPLAPTEERLQERAVEKERKAGRFGRG